MSRTFPFPSLFRLEMVLSKIAAAGILGGLLLELGAPLALRSEAVHLRAVVEGFLRARHVAWLAAPRFERRILQRARIREGQRPRQALRRRHGIQVRGRRFVGLPARQEHDAGL